MGYPLPTVTIGPGSRMGAYEIVGAIGAGGMGEVWRARDSRLGRDVAVKVVPESLVDNGDRLARFEREAQAAGGLNHPNLLTIHEFGVSDGRHFIVSELLDGTTLRGKIEAGPLPPRRAIEYASQIAEGLAAAHEHGVVHRDLKPENIFVTRDGRVKILDFGLATITAGPSPRSAEGAASETDVKPLTDPGTVVGTAGYMSPEQVRGEIVDARSDIFSLGAIVYEMVSGRRAFRGHSSIDTMHAILHDDPAELSQTGTQVPPALERVIGHCLEKAPEQRFQSARDLAFALASMSTTSAERIVPRQRISWRGTPLWIAAIALAIAATWFGSRATLHTAAPRFQRVTFHSLSFPNAVFSADQQSVVYSSYGSSKSADIYVSAIGKPEMRPMGIRGASVLSPSRTGDLAILMDVQFLGGFIFTGTLARVPFEGGAPRQLVNDVQWADWIPGRDDLLILRSVGGTSRIEMPIGHVVYETSSWISTPRISPDGKSIAFTEHPVANDDAGLICVLGADHRKKVLSPLYTSASGVAWHPGGKEIWYTGAALGSAKKLWAVDVSRGKPRLLADLPGNSEIHDIARDGRVLLSEGSRHLRVFVRGAGDEIDRDLSWLDWTLLRDVSADGRTVLFDETGDGGGDLRGVYIRNIDGSPAVRLGDGVATGIAPDGNSVLASKPNEQPRQVYLYPIGPGDVRQLTHDDIVHLASAWTPDGKSFVFRGTRKGQGARLYVQSITGGAPRAISPEGVGGVPVCSPDGRWVWSRGPDSTAVLYPLNGGREMRLTAMTAQDGAVGWSPDGRSIRYFRRNTNPVPIFELDIATGQPKLLKEINLPEASAAFGAINVRLSADGRTIAYSAGADASDLYIAENLK